MPNVKGKKYGCIVIDSRFITKNGRTALKSVFPLFLKYSTSDLLDIIAYMLGTITYYLLFYKQNNMIVKE